MKDPCQPRSSAGLDYSSGMKTLAATAGVSVLLLAACSTENPGADLVSSWDVSFEHPTGIRGVSPELVEIDGVTTLIVTSLDPDKYWTTDDGISFEKTSVQMPPGADYTVIEQPDGSWRLYFADFLGDFSNAPPGPDDLKGVLTTTTNDFLSFGPVEETGVAQLRPGRAWGVPDTVQAPDGSVFMYWVDEVDGERWEVVRLATSRDGVNFDVQADPVIFGGYVDPFVLQAEEGNWLMLLSTTPHPSELPQKLHLARSDDGIAWEVDPTPLFEDEQWNYLDPTAIPQGDSWLIVSSRASLEEAQNPENAELIAGTLTKLP